MVLTLDGVGEGGVQVEDHLLEAVGLVLLTSLVEEVDLDVPLAEREALRSGRLVGAVVSRQFRMGKKAT